MKHCYLPSACIESVILPQVKKQAAISRMSIITELLHYLTQRPKFLKQSSYDILMMLSTVICINLALRKDCRAIKTVGFAEYTCQSQQCNSTNSVAILRMEIKHVAAYYFLRTIMWRVDLQDLYAKVLETWHYCRATICA